MPQVRRIEEEPGTFLTTVARMRDALRDGVRTVAESPRIPHVSVQGDESLVVDDRVGMSPAEMVENKLSRMLKDGSMPVSHLQMRRLLRAR